MKATERDGIPGVNGAPGSQANVGVVSLSLNALCPPLAGGAEGTKRESDDPAKGRRSAWPGRNKTLPSHHVPCSLHRQSPLKTSVQGSVMTQGGGMGRFKSEGYTLIIQLIDLLCCTAETNTI